MSDTCKHFHAPGVRHVPCPDCAREHAQKHVAELDSEIERLRKRIEIISKAAPDPGTLRNMLRAMQNGELTVSRGIELVDMWLAGNYRDDMLPPVREGLGEDEMPWDRIDALTKQLDAARNCERVWETSMMGAVGEDGPGDVVKAIDSIKQQRDELLALVKSFHRKLETYRNVYSGDKELRRLLSECVAAIAKVKP